LRATVAPFLALACSFAAIAGEGDPPALPKLGDAVEIDRLSLRVPEGWEAREGHQGAIVALISPREHDDDPFPENVNLTAEVIAREVDLDTYVDRAIEDLEASLTGFELIDRSESQIAGRRARVIEYRVEWDEASYHLLAFLVLDQDRALVLTATATADRFDRWRPLFDVIARSFAIAGEE